MMANFALSPENGILVGCLSPGIRSHTSSTVVNLRFVCAWAFTLIEKDVAEPDSKTSWYLESLNAVLTSIF